jgi:hypothetical protein
MKIPLTEIIQKSVALPLPVNTKPYRLMMVEELNATRILTRHAANALPQLLNAIGDYLRSLDASVINKASTADMRQAELKLLAALARAETVEVEQ